MVEAQRAQNAMLSNLGENKELNAVWSYKTTVKPLKTENIRKAEL